MSEQPPRFAGFDAELLPRTALRRAITAAYRRPEAECLAPLLDRATLAPDAAERVAVLARDLVTRLRAKTATGGIEGLIQEYSLSSQEGIALMCLAEALLRIPDAATRDALIRDKLAPGDWRAHLGHSPSMFVNAATWGLMLTGQLVATSSSEQTLAAALTRLIGRGGEPVIRRGVDLAMRMMGEQFVKGQTIEEALANSRSAEARGFSYSYDMLGEAAATAEDAANYLAAYQRAIHAIGAAAQRRGVYRGPGISIKLSALHPRYGRAQRTRVMAELLPRVKALAVLAKHYDIGFNIDAEEADRLELSLDLLEALSFDDGLASWQGLGFVIQAYGKRCPFVVDWLIDLARRSARRLMVRLVKGAYWDAEIKRAQVDGLDDFPVYTSKAHTDVSYLACARLLLAAPEAVFPQFATHNAQTLAAIMVMAGRNFHPGQYEFQCLHGMGEPLYDEVVGPDQFDRPCRIYAPVGTHETLLAYLVRRLLENGANTSFVNRIGDPSVAVEELIADPVAVVRSRPSPGAPHPRIALPRDLYRPGRINSLGLDLTNEDALDHLAAGFRESTAFAWMAQPAGAADQPGQAVCNPADHRDVVGYYRDTTRAEIESALAAAASAAPGWAATTAEWRAALLRRAADAFEQRLPVLIGLLIREAGKSCANAIAEVREAVDFLRYYAAEAAGSLSVSRPAPLGPVVCISPWNFPLAIFTGQLAAALAAGNTVLAKPAEQTPLIAAEAIRLLHHAGMAADVLQLLPGSGEVGAALVADSRVQAVMFTGSTAVARLIQRQLADRLGRTGKPVPLIAETGGLNAMVVDSSALAEQVVADVIASAFDSAGQRCSALRILCLQEEVADRILSMLNGAMHELSIGDPARLSTDIGPVITLEARDAINRHIDRMRAVGHTVVQLDLAGETAHGSFVAPTLIEISRISDLDREIFGPVLHVLRYRRAQLDSLIADINATGYGLTFGLHTRLDETIAQILGRIEAGNIYVNRSIIGATVGTQPFGGVGLSGTGPKAGGPLYLQRLVATPASVVGPFVDGGAAPRAAVARAYLDWLADHGWRAEAERMVGYLSRCRLGAVELPGPVGERNDYQLRPRGRIAAPATTATGLLTQLGAILATGNRALVATDHPARALLDSLPAIVADRISFAPIEAATDLRAVLFDGDPEGLRALNRRLAQREGPILAVVAITPDGLAAGDDYDLNFLLEERSISTNTAAAGGNASLMTIG
jgi:RHH-type proline utilization regulon transcriptional repressor/proline dehydrogenase/delta 1-pyrroline-5-carboxylate dehydrogenase